MILGRSQIQSGPIAGGAGRIEVRAEIPVKRLGGGVALIVVRAAGADDGAGQLAGESEYDIRILARAAKGDRDAVVISWVDLRLTAGNDHAEKVAAGRKADEGEGAIAGGGLVVLVAFEFPVVVQIRIDQHTAVPHAIEFDPTGDVQPGGVGKQSAGDRRRAHGNMLASAQARVTLPLAPPAIPGGRCGCLRASR